MCQGRANDPPPATPPLALGIAKAPTLSPIPELKSAVIHVPVRLNTPSPPINIALASS